MLCCSIDFKVIQNYIYFSVVFVVMKKNGVIILDTCLKMHYINRNYTKFSSITVLQWTRVIMIKLIV